MKKIIYSIIVVSVLFSACIKQPVDPTGAPVHCALPPSYLANVQAFILQYIATGAYESIDFSKYHISKQQVDWYIRIALKNKLFSQDFIIVKTDSLGYGLAARFIHLEKESAAAARNSAAVTNNNNSSYNGSIDIISLDRKTTMHSAIVSGYIKAWHPDLFNAKPGKSTDQGGNQTTGLGATGSQKEATIPVPYDELPEVVVVGYSSPAGSGGISASDYMMLQSLFDGGGGGGAPNTGAATGGGYGNGVYSPVDYNTGAGSNPGATHSPTTEEHLDQDITLTFDESFSRPAIDLNTWMKCFTNIPDAGALSSITLLGDLPSDGDPSTGLNIWNGNTGHCFLQLSKTNGAQSVTQIIGFTAQSAGRAILNADAFVPSKIVDNAGHKYNCSITMMLSSPALKEIISTIQSLSAMPYSIVNYDCLDFGLNVFNAVRPANPLVISKKYDPNQPFSNIANGPKLYSLLQNMLESGSSEAANIWVGSSRYAGVSHGPCN